MRNITFAYSSCSTGKQQERSHQLYRSDNGNNKNVRSKLYLFPSQQNSRSLSISEAHNSLLFD